MTEYKRRKGSDTWHWCKNCSSWPQFEYESRHEKPTYGELCNECKAKEQNQNCKR